MTKPTGIHITAMHRVMKYFIASRDKGLYIKPDKQSDGKDKNA
jgi:hypothetical protein